ncbi:unnamed protein product [Rotaria sordida]|uniref:PARP catalytic domain-containing protein n=1 Tax=Rotaria sordida TaxID=392033 RepID=A0A814YG86_9BILA|nr:unnamed protein product [Rotaria sordida]
MCLCNCPFIYKKLAYLHALTGFLEMVFGIVRLGIFFTPTNASTNTRKPYSQKYVAAFIIDWISSIVPTLVGLFVALIILVILCKLCAFCINSYNREKGRQNQDINTSGILRRLIRNKALRRFLIADCNCPCYKARPKLRFQMRFGLLVAFFILRIVSIGLYASSIDGDGGILAIICAISLIFLFNTIWLDLYRYCVWWHYSPSDDTRCHLRSKQHERYLPYHMVGEYRDPRTLGDRPCTDKPCHKRKLDHIAVFHSNDYQPQDRWRDIPKLPYQAVSNEKKFLCWKSDEIDNQPHYIGFHTTDPKSAIAIAHSQFRPGTNGWLGPGVYFARSIEGTIGKAKSSGGATIIAEIRMGKVYEVDRDHIANNHPNFKKEIYEYVHHGGWQKEYDTCYMIHHDDFRDEFAIRNANKQIVKWVMVIDQQFDSKVEDYGLITEFDSTKCFCI